MTLDAEFLNRIFDEIRAQQATKKIRNVYGQEVASIQETEKLEKNIYRKDIELLVVNRVIGNDLFSSKGIPLYFIHEVQGMDEEDIADLIQECQTQISRTLFNKNNKYYFSRTLAIFWHLKHAFPIIMDCFRKGELSTKKENIMIAEYQKTGVQVILSSTLKDEEYSSGTKYYDIDGVNAINYESNPNSHILQSIYCEQFMRLVDSFGIVY